MALDFPGSISYPARVYLRMSAKLRRILLICTLGAFVGMVVISLNPLHGRVLNLGWLGCLVGAWAGFMLLVWDRKRARAVALVLPCLVAMPFLLPGGGIDPDELRQNYVRRMGGFEGVNYVWGGESRRGIDCSGLSRRAFRDALLAYGLRRANGRAFRAFAEQWWFDASAEALGQGYRNYTVPIGTSGTIREMDYSALMPGDLAVTNPSVHVLAYLGDGRWIQADPSIGAVAILDGREDDNIWFRAPVTTHRWNLLAP